MTAIELRNLTKAFGETIAVDRIDLTIGSGELFFLLGPSGCGKTTLLRMLAGFIEPTRGFIRFGDRDVTLLPPNRRNTGMVFQSYALWPHMSVAENVAYGLQVRKVNASERQSRVMQALRAVHMEEFAARKPNQLSGGQQQRIALARALVIQPTVLLLDEPLSNLDAKLRLEMRSEIRRICSQTGITTVYVTHDQKEALSLADNMAVLRHGQTVQAGPPRRLYERPETRFVADFLGETNFLSAVVRGTTDHSISLETAAGVLQSTAIENAPQGGNVTVSIRPEAWVIADARDGAKSALNVARGNLASSTYLGEVAQHQVTLSDGQSVRVFELNPRIQRRVGSEITITVDPADVVILRD